MPKNVAPRAPLNAERLRELLAYDPETGEFRWKVYRSPHARAGDAAGCAKGNGYRKICVDRRYYHAHRLAYLWMTGAWPPEDVDHRNRQRADNRFQNLRPADKAQNAANTGLYRNSRSGFRGVARVGDKWKAHVSVRGIYQHLGMFKPAEEAALAAQAARESAFGEFAST
jgi:hypothetical protein